jgi:uncharacterized membrane protein YeiH
LRDLYNEEDVEFWLSDTIFYIASMVGSIAFALSGYFLAVRKNLDLMGAFILAFLTANGGGVVRDLVLGRPVGNLLSAEPFWTVLLVVLLAWLLKARRYMNTERRWAFIISDAIGLCAFALTGALIGIEEGLHIFGVVTLALMTAAGGGIIRDILVNEVPEILHGGFYGTVAILVGVCVYMMDWLGLLSAVWIVVIYFLALITRLAGWYWRWGLPKSR